jgi:hypothetical protein
MLSSQTVSDESIDDIVGVLLLSIKEEADANCKTPDDLLVLGFVRILQHLFQCLIRRGAEHDETHGVACSLASHSAVIEEHDTQILIDVWETKQIG